MQPASRDRFSDVDSHIRMFLARCADEHASKYDRETPLVPDYTLECDQLLEIRT